MGAPLAETVLEYTAKTVNIHEHKKWNVEQLKPILILRKLIEDSETKDGEATDEDFIKDGEQSKASVKNIEFPSMRHIDVEAVGNQGLHYLQPYARRVLVYIYKYSRIPVSAVLAGTSAAIITNLHPNEVSGKSQVPNEKWENISKNNIKPSAILPQNLGKVAGWLAKGQSPLWAAVKIGAWYELIQPFIQPVRFINAHPEHQRRKDGGRGRILLGANLGSDFVIRFNALDIGHCCGNGHRSCR